MAGALRAAVRIKPSDAVTLRTGSGPLTPTCARRFETFSTAATWRAKGRSLRSIDWAILGASFNQLEISGASVKATAVRQVTVATTAKTAANPVGKASLSRA